MHPMLNIATRAARKAGNLITKYYESTDTLKVDKKSFSKNINNDVEHLIIEVIRKFYPLHTILSEKYGELPGKNKEVQWIINPLDGIINFIKRLPHFNVSITVQIKDRTEVAVIYDPMRNELFSASRGQSAQLNGHRLRGGAARNLASATLATGLSITHKQHSINHSQLLSTMLARCANFRCSGSVMLDMAYVAAGRIDGFFEVGLKTWGCAGGELLVREAGGLVTDFTGGHNHLLSGNIVAGNPHVVKSILSVMRSNLSELPKY